MLEGMFVYIHPAQRIARHSQGTVLDEVGCALRRGDVNHVVRVGNLVNYLPIFIYFKDSLFLVRAISTKLCR